MQFIRPAAAVAAPAPVVPPGDATLVTMFTNPAAPVPAAVQSATLPGALPFSLPTAHHVLVAPHSAMVHGI